MYVQAKMTPNTIILASSVTYFGLMFLWFFTEFPSKQQVGPIYIITLTWGMITALIILIECLRHKLRPYDKYELIHAPV